MGRTGEANNSITIDIGTLIRKARTNRKAVVAAVITFWLLVAPTLAAFSVVFVKSAKAAQPVFDSQGAITAGKQLTEMRKQLEAMQEANQALHDQLTAFGAGSTIRLIGIDQAAFGSQIVKNFQCLIPDLESLMPRVEFDTVDFGDMCQRADVYGQTLTVDPARLQNSSVVEREQARTRVKFRRAAILEDSVLKGLGSADQAFEESNVLNEEADTLSSEADSAENMNERLAVIAKGQVLLVRAMAQNNQLLAQLVKQQAAYYTNYALPTDKLVPAGGGDNGDQ